MNQTEDSARRSFEAWTSRDTETVRSLSTVFVTDPTACTGP